MIFEKKEKKKNKRKNKKKVRVKWEGKRGGCAGGVRLVQLTRQKYEKPAFENVRGIL